MKGSKFWWLTLGLMTLLIAGWGVHRFWVSETLDPPEVSHEALEDLESEFFLESDPPVAAGDEGDSPEAEGPEEALQEKVENPPAEGALGPSGSLTPEEKTPPESPEAGPSKEIPVEELKIRYESKFLLLQEIAVESLDEILLAMKEEYLVASGEEKESEIFKAKLITKYTKAALDLEKRVDDLFYFILSELKDRLEGAPEGGTVIDEFETTYQEEKEALREALMNKVLQESK